VKAFLLYANRDLDLERELPPNHEDLVQDLELSTLFGAMGAGDKFLLDIANRVVLTSLDDPEAIAYRQRVMADCLQHPEVARQIYTLAVEAIEGERRGWYFRPSERSSPDMILHWSVKLMQHLVGVLRKLRRVADEHAEGFRSDGFRRFFAMLGAELDDAYFETVEEHLRRLEFRGGVLMSVRLGRGNKGAGYVLRRPRELSWVERLPFRSRGTSYSFQIAPRDESGSRALAEIRGRGINLVADALAQSTDHIRAFFQMVRAELAFYVGCLNLYERLAAKGEPTCFPVPEPAGEPRLGFEGLIDPCLSLHVDARVVGNDGTADAKRLLMVTGSNQGGKSTFLRSLGLAQLMMHCGMFVAARRFRADVRDGVFTHYKREEDATMQSGKLDEELARMSAIVDRITPGSLLLCNESFASTNEREGSEIARQVVDALLEAGVKVGFVTHLFELADGYHRKGMESALFLRAERAPDGTRTLRIVEGEPKPTSHGQDVYERIFGAQTEAVAGRG
jgi:DNA mismatch repair ATPase MutS